MSSTSHQAPFVNGGPLPALPPRDLVVLVFIAKLGTSRLRADWNVVDDLAALRHELGIREGVAA